MQRNFIVYIFMIFMIIYIYSYVYLCIYTPSYHHFKAFAVSKFDSETTFMYQLFNKNWKFTVYKPFNMFLQVYMYIFINTISNQHFKAFTVSTVTTSTGLCATCTRQETRMSFCVLTCTRASFLAGGGFPRPIYLHAWNVWMWAILKPNIHMRIS